MLPRAMLTSPSPRLESISAVAAHHSAVVGFERVCSPQSGRQSTESLYGLLVSGSSAANTRVTGTPDSPQNFTITHDDSTTFAVNGQPPPGPTRVGELQRFFHFYLYECCEGQAGLETSLIGPQTAPTPEPREVAFLLVGCSPWRGLFGASWCPATCRSDPRFLSCW